MAHRIGWNEYENYRSESAIRNKETDQEDERLFRKEQDMKLTWKDLYISLVAGGVAASLVAALLGYDWSLFASWKGAVGTLSFLGVLMLLPEDVDLANLNAWGVIEWVLFISGIGLAVAGLIVASKALFVLLAADILAFWLTSISRHMFSHEAHVRHISFPAT